MFSVIIREIPGSYNIFIYLFGEALTTAWSNGIMMNKTNYISLCNPVKNNLIKVNFRKLWNHNATQKHFSVIFPFSNLRLCLSKD